MIHQWKDIGEFLSDARTNQAITHGKCKFSKSREGKNKGKNKLKNERKKKFIQCFSAARKVVTINRFVKTFLYTAQLHDSVLAHILWGTSPVWVFCRMSSAHLSQAKSPQMGELSVFRTVECEQLGPYLMTCAQSFQTSWMWIWSWWWAPAPLVLQTIPSTPFNTWILFYLVFLFA